MVVLRNVRNTLEKKDSATIERQMILLIKQTVDMLKLKEEKEEK